MAVWLKCGTEEVAFDNDIVPREAMMQLVELDALVGQARRQAGCLLETARRQADELCAAAESQALALADKARRDAAAVTRLGYAQGRLDGLRHWHAAACEQRRADAAAYVGQRERLADMVVQATAGLLRGPVLAVYLENAFRALDDLARKDLTLSLTVHPQDADQARKAIETMRPLWRDGTTVELIERASADPGHCVCESSRGYIDAGLPRQLASLRQAALGALEALELPVGVVAEAGGDPPREPPVPPEPAGRSGEGFAESDRSGEPDDEDFDDFLDDDDDYNDDDDDGTAREDEDYPDEAAAPAAGRPRRSAGSW